MCDFAQNETFVQIGIGQIYTIFLKLAYFYILTQYSKLIFAFFHLNLSNANNYTDFIIKYPFIYHI